LHELKCMKKVLYDILLNAFAGISCYYQTIFFAVYIQTKISDYNLIRNLAVWNALSGFVVYFILRTVNKISHPLFLRRFHFVIIVFSLFLLFDIAKNVLSFFSFYHFLNYAIAAMLTVLYVFGKYALRKIFLLKYIVVPLAWILVNYISVLLSDAGLLHNMRTWLPFVFCQMVFIIVCMLPFDILDRFSDKRDMTTTIPLRWGLRTTIYLILLLLGSLIIFSEKKYLISLIAGGTMVILSLLVIRRRRWSACLAESALWVQGFAGVYLTL